MLGSSSEKIDSVVCTCQYFVALNAQSTRHGARPVPELAPWCTGGPPLRAPQPRAREKTHGRRRKACKCFFKNTLVHSNMILIVVGFGLFFHLQLIPGTFVLYFYEERLHLIITPKEKALQSDKLSGMRIFSPGTRTFSGKQPFSAAPFFPPISSHSRRKRRH